MDVATLTATLELEIAAMQRNAAAADATLASLRKELEATEAAADGVSRAVSDIRPDTARFAAGVSTMKGALVSFKSEAREAEAAARDIGVSDAQMVKIRAMTAEVEQLRNKLLEADAASKGGGGSGRGGGGGFLSGILPGGQRAGAGAVTAGIGLLAATGPALVPAAAGLGAVLPAAMEGLVGVAGTLKLAFADLSAQAFTTKKAFDALTPVQQQFVQHLRSLDAGLIKGHLEPIAQQAVLPGLTAGLGAAVTPASIQMMTSAVREFGGAISAAAKAWGAMFGSTQFAQSFGAVLASDARGAQVFFVGLSRLFDGMVHLQQAAIPLVTWMQNGFGAFTRWADSSIKAAQGSGQLAHFFDEARQSLQALGGLVASVAGALHSLTSAFGGFSTAISIINTLSRAFGEIGSILNQNKQVLTDVFRGLIASVGDAISVVHGLAAALRPLLAFIDAVAKDFGGWRPIIDAVAAFFVAKMILNIGWVNKLGVSLGLLGPKTTAAATEMEAALAPVVAELQTLNAELAGVGPAAAAGAAEADGALAGIGAAAAAALGPVSALLAALAGAYVYYKFLTSHQAAAGGPSQGIVEPKKGGPIYAIGGGRVAGMNYGNAQQAAAARLGVTLNDGSALQSTHGLGGDQSATGAGNMGPPLQVGSKAWWVKTVGFDPYGTPPPLTTTGGGGGGGGGSVPGLVSPETTLAKAQAAFAQGTGTGTTPQQQLVASKEYLATLEKIKSSVEAQSGSAKQNLTIQRELASIARDMNTAKKEQAKAEAAIVQAQKDQKAMTVLGASSSTQTPAVMTLTRELKNLRSEVAKTPDLGTSAVKAEMRKLAEALKVDPHMSATVRQSWDSMFQSLKQTVSSHLTSIKDAARQAVQDASTQFTQAVSDMNQVADTLFQQQTDSTVKSMTDALNDTVSQMQAAESAHIQQMQIMVHSGAGSFMFGGAITKTPAELALQQMQDQHDANQRQLALVAAQQQLAQAQAGGNPLAIQQARQSVAEAQYAITVASLEQQATVQKDAAATQLTAAQNAYKQQQDAAIKAYQDEQQALIDNYSNQRAIQKEQMDQQVGQFITLMQEYPSSAKTYLEQIVGVWQAHGVPAYNASFSLGGNIYSGFYDALTPLDGMLTTLLTKLAALAGLDPAAAAKLAAAAGMTVPAPPKPRKRGVQGYGMAEGGVGLATGEALFYTRGNEEFAFSGEGKRFGRAGAGGGEGQPIVLEIHTHADLNGREVMHVVRNELIRLGRSNKTVISGPGVNA